MPNTPNESSPGEPDVGHDAPRPVGPVRQRVRRTAPAAEPLPDDNASDRKPSDYLVGYGRPPADTRFKSGQSGNPKGRPKGARGLNTLARELLTQKVAVRTASGEKKMRRIEAVLHKTFELALKGNPRAVSQILSLYASSVPETAEADPQSPADELTATDLAILEEFKASVLKEKNQ